MREGGLGVGKGIVYHRGRGILWDQTCCGVGLVSDTSDKGCYGLVE